MLILAIETSCDETAVALVKSERGGFHVVENIVSSQVKTHAPFGGVVPDLAARDHLKNLPIILKKIIAKNRLSSEKIDLLAVTEGPGLIPALLIGTNCAKALAYAWKKPLVGVHHIAGHIYANFVRENSKFEIRNSKLETNKLSNSGSRRFRRAYTADLMKKHLDFKIVGETLDDAAGEAFDKVAKILGLGYPGGPAIAAEAAKFPISNFSPYGGPFAGWQFSNKSKNKNTKYEYEIPNTNSLVR